MITPNDIDEAYRNILSAIDCLHSSAIDAWFTSDENLKKDRVKHLDICLANYIESTGLHSLCVELRNQIVQELGGEDLK